MGHIWENVSAAGALELLDFLFWPALWIVTYVCVLALIVQRVGRIFASPPAAAYAVRARPAERRRGLLLMTLGILGLIGCAAAWESLFGNLREAADLLIARIHGVKDLREVAILSGSTLSILVADIGSILFLDAQAG